MHTTPLPTKHGQRGISLLSVIILLLLIGGAIGGWYYYQQQQAAAEAKQSFITDTVKKGSITYSVNASGMVYPKNTVDVGAQVSGKIAKLTVEIGDAVKAGDLIAEIDASTKENAKLSAQAQLKGQQATLKTAQSTLKEAQSAYNRANKLYKSGAGSQADNESAYATLMSAKNAVTAAEEDIVQSQLTIKDAEVSLGYTTITAPIDGTVIAVPVDEGSTVNASQSTPTIVTLAQTNVMTVKAEIAEADISVMSVGLPVTFTLLGKNTNTYNGTLQSIDPAPKEIADDGSIDSDTAIYYYGHIDVDNAEGKLRYGMTATITIAVDKADDALIIPMTAINDTPRGSMVLVLENDKPRPHRVEIGLEDGVNAEVLSGLSEGDKVIISSGSKRSSTGRRKGRGAGGPPGGMF